MHVLPGYLGDVVVDFAARIVCSVERVFAKIHECCAVPSPSERDVTVDVSPYGTDGFVVPRCYPSWGTLEYRKG